MKGIETLAQWTRSNTSMANSKHFRLSGYDMHNYLRVFGHSGTQADILLIHSKPEDSIAQISI